MQATREAMKAVAGIDMQATREAMKAVAGIDMQATREAMKAVAGIDTQAICRVAPKSWIANPSNSSAIHDLGVSFNDAKS